jgi:hypothetical protein
MGYRIWDAALPESSAPPRITAPTPAHAAIRFAIDRWVDTGFAQPMLQQTVCVRTPEGEVVVMEVKAETEKGTAMSGDKLTWHANSTTAKTP